MCIIRLGLGAANEPPCCNFHAPMGINRLADKFPARLKTVFRL
ncbi:MAG: hypothetical protein ACR2L1_03270 [Pyrinomonadaceae bacterium]